MGSNSRVCQKCLSKLVLDSMWIPPQGMDPLLRRFLCSGFSCGEEYYLKISIKEVLRGVKGEFPLSLARHLFTTRLTGILVISRQL